MHIDRMSASAFNTLAHLDVENRRVLVRLDLNEDESLRPQALDSSLSTIRELLHRGARVILAGHRSGQPNQEGKEAKLPSLRRTGSRLAQALECPVSLPDEVVGDGARKLIRDTRGGQIVLLENLDLDPREAQGNSELARQLAELCDVFVLDAVSACLESRASIEGIAQRMPDAVRGVGHRLERHLELATTLAAPSTIDNTLIFGADRPELLSLAALAKMVETRAPKDALVLSGRLGQYFFLLSQGQQLDHQTVSADLRGHMRAILDRAKERGLKLILPYDLAPAPAGESLAKEAEAPAEAQLTWGEQSRRDLIAALHVQRVAWLGPFEIGHHRQDGRWLADRLLAHERELIALGAAPLRALAGSATGPASQEGSPDPASSPVRGVAPDSELTQGLGLSLDFVLARIAKAPIPGLAAIAVQEQAHDA